MFPRSSIKGCRVPKPGCIKSEWKTVKYKPSLTLSGFTLWYTINAADTCICHWYIVVKFGINCDNLTNKDRSMVIQAAGRAREMELALLIPDQPELTILKQSLTLSGTRILILIANSLFQVIYPGIFNLWNTWDCHHLFSFVSLPFAWAADSLKAFHLLDYFTPSWLVKQMFQ